MTRSGKFSLAASEWLPWTSCRKGLGRRGASMGFGVACLTPGLPLETISTLLGERWDLNKRLPQQE